MLHEHADDADSDDPLARCRELLADEAAGLSDDEIDRIRAHADALARVIVELYLAAQDARSRSTS